jgi:hypothetical protein
MMMVVSGFSAQEMLESSNPEESKEGSTSFFSPPKKVERSKSVFSKPENQLVLQEETGPLFTKTKSKAPLVHGRSRSANGGCDKPVGLSKFAPQKQF